MPKMSDMSVMLFPWGARCPTVQELIDTARLAEDLGFHSVTLPTHMTLPPGWLFTDFTNRDVLDALVIVPAIAAATSRIKVGFNSILPPLLPPYEWAKYLSTLDVMTEGRAIAGVAMGWWEEDFTSMGVQRKFRGKLFDEQLDVITRLLTEEVVTHDGRFYQLSEMTLEPKSVQKPYPPIWIGGGPMSIDRTARYGEYILCFWPSADEAKDFWVPRLAEAGERHGTNPKLAAFSFFCCADDDKGLEPYVPLLESAVTFEHRQDLTPLDVTVVGTPERCAQQINHYFASGVSHFVLEFQFHGVKDAAFGNAQMERFARDVAPLLDS